jgi:hypothetical protein
MVAGPLELEIKQSKHSLRSNAAFGAYAFCYADIQGRAVHSMG